MPAAPILLIADRNEDALKYLGELPMEYDVLHAKDGQEALFIVETHTSQIAVAVVELELPGVNGLTVIGRLTTREPKPMKIIATTFLESEPLLEIAKHMGADVIVRKPCPEETWVGMLSELLPARMDDAQPGT